MPSEASQQQYPHQQSDTVSTLDLAQHYSAHKGAYHPGLQPIVERMIGFAEHSPTADQLVADSLATNTKSAEQHRQEALTHLRESAAVLSSLSMIGTAGTEGILAAKESKATEAEIEAKHASAEKLSAEQERKEDVKRGHEALEQLQDLLRVMPTAQKGHIQNLDRLVTYTFRSDRLEDIRQLETQVLWLPRVDFDPQKVDGDPESGKHDRYRYARKDDDVSFLSVHETLVPFFVVGERPTPLSGSYDKESKDDAFVDLLLVKASQEDGETPELVVVTTSSRLKDVADELAIEELADPVTEKELDWRYLQKDGTYLLNGGTLSSINTITGKRKIHKRGSDSNARPRNRTLYEQKGGVDLADPPRLGKSRRNRYWSKQKRKIDGVGLPADIRPLRDYEVAGSFFDEFNIKFNAQKLAILLGREQAYAEILKR